MTTADDRTPQPPADMTPAAIDERKAERLALALPVTYAFERAGDRLIGDTETTNVSGGGVQFPIPTAVETGTPCQLYLTLPEQSETLSMSGRVIWCRPARNALVESFEVGISCSPQGCDRLTFERYCHFVAAQLLLKYLR